MGLGSFFKKTGRLYEKGFKSSIKSVANPLGMKFGGGGGSGPGSSGAYEQAQANYANSIAQQSQSLNDIGPAYEKARKAQAGSRTRAIQYAQDAGTQANAQVAQSTADRGLYNTTILDNARMGVSAGVSRQVADIDAQYAQIMAQLGLGEQQAKQGVRNNIAQSYQGLAALQSGNLNQTQALQQQWALNQNPNAWLDSLFQIGGTALGYGLGGGFSSGGGGGGWKSSQGLF